MVAATRSVEQEIAWLKVADRHRGGVSHLGTRVVRQGDTGHAPGVLGQSGAVQPDTWSIATPDVRDAKLGLRCGDCSATRTARGGRNRNAATT